MTRAMAVPRAARRSLRLSVVLVMVAGFVVAGAPAQACSCGGSARENLPYAEGAFVGVLEGKDVTGFNSVEWTFRVERVAKGEFGPIAIVRTPEQESACGLHLRTRERVGLLLQRGDDGVWHSSLCAQYEQSEVLSAVTRPYPPDPTIDPIGGGILPLPWWGSGLIGAAAAGGILFVRARRSRRSAA